MVRSSVLAQIAANEDSAAETYDRVIVPAREIFEHMPVLKVVLADTIAPNRLLAFLLHFCALGVAMTVSVEDWIRRAGKRCQSLGYAKLGAALIDHSRHERGHDALMRADTHALAALWNRRTNKHPVDPEELLSLDMPLGARRYHDLHEGTISGSAPYAQIAIEYEIERLSIVYGGRLVENCARRLGSDVLTCLSFVHEHVALDEGHTMFNRRRLVEFLAERPDKCAVLVAAGKAALEAYSQYLSDCLRLGDALASSD